MGQLRHPCVLVNKHERLLRGIRERQADDPDRLQRPDVQWSAGERPQLRGCQPDGFRVRLLPILFMHLPQSDLSRQSEDRGHPGDRPAVTVSLAKTWRRSVGLITRRSQVQILPPLLERLRERGLSLARPVIRWSHAFAGAFSDVPSWEWPRL